MGWVTPQRAFRASDTPLSLKLDTVLEKREKRIKTEFTLSVLGLFEENTNMGTGAWGLTPLTTSGVLSFAFDHQFQEKIAKLGDFTLPLHDPPEQS